MRWASCDNGRPKSSSAQPGDLDYAAGRFQSRQAGGAAIALAELMQATLTDGAVIGRGVSTKLPLGVEIGAARVRRRGRH